MQVLSGLTDEHLGSHVPVMNDADSCGHFRPWNQGRFWRTPTWQLFPGKAFVNMPNKATFYIRHPAVVRHHKRYVLGDKAGSKHCPYFRHFRLPIMVTVTSKRHFSASSRRPPCCIMIGRCWGARPVSFIRHYAMRFFPIMPPTKSTPFV